LIAEFDKAMVGILRFFARMTGLVLLLAALAVLGHDLLAWRADGVFAPLPLGRLWLYISRGSLAAVQRDLPDPLWNPALVTVLSAWAAPSLAIPGFMLYWSARRRRR
jgi:hypothetical protein